MFWSSRNGLSVFNRIAVRTGGVDRLNLMANLCISFSPRHVKRPRTRKRACTVPLKAPFNNPSMAAG